MKNTLEWKEKVESMKMYSTQAATLLHNISLDFVYIDARHDYCGVMEDLEAILAQTTSRWDYGRS